MKKLLFLLLLFPLVVQGAAPYYISTYPLTNGHVMVGLGGGKVAVTNAAAVKTMLGITDSAGVYPNTTQLGTNAATVLLSVISGATLTNTVFRSGDSGAATNAVDIETRQLFYQDGVTAAIDWGAGAANSFNGQTSVNFDSREGIDSSGQAALSWEGRLLYDSGLDASLNWQNRVLSNETGGTNIDYRISVMKDTSNQYSVDYANRRLHNSVSTIVLDWQNSFLYGRWIVWTNLTVAAVDPVVDSATNVFSVAGIKGYRGLRYGTNDWLYGGTNLVYNNYHISDQGHAMYQYMLSSNGFSSDGIRYINMPTNVPVVGDVIIASSTLGPTKWGIPGAATNSVGASFDGAGAVLTAGTVAYMSVDKTGTMLGWEIIANGSSPTCTIDIWKIAAGTAIPTVSNTIMGTKPALASGNVLRSGAMTGWTTAALDTGDILAFNIDACTVATKLTVKLIYRSTQ